MNVNQFIGWEEGFWTPPNRCEPTPAILDAGKRSVMRAVALKKHWQSEENSIAPDEIKELNVLFNIDGKQE